MQPPTATVPPTLMPARSLPVVSDVSASYPSSVYGTGAYSTGYVQQSLPSTMANTVYSTGYLQTVAPQFYSGGFPSGSPFLSGFLLSSVVDSDFKYGSVFNLRCL